MQHSFSLLFWINKNKINKNGDAPIYARVTVNGKRAEIATGEKINPERWTAKLSCVKGNREDARTINNALDRIRLKIKGIYNLLLEEGYHISADLVKDNFIGKKRKEHSVLEVFKYHNEQMRAQVGKEYALGTYKRYETSLMLTEEFIKHKYNRSDMQLSELNFSFITEYEFYLKTVRNNNHNTTIKYLRNFKKIIHMAVANDWLQKYPFLAHKVTIKEVKRDFLTQEELDRIDQKKFSTGRLELVKDIFVFCCYTGLSYVDVAKLTPNNIDIGIDGDQWLFVDRTKTGNPSHVPLLAPALAIIQKYQNNLEAENKGLLLPMISNQKLNAYLKEIADVCNIQKHLTFHIARHTFATTVTLTNGVPIESVSSMLGHKNLRTTQIYAKVVKKKISDDMRKLKEKLSNHSGENRMIN
jgi:site-specific recombinase XerD